MNRRLRITVAAAAGAAVLGTVAVALPADAATPNLQFHLIQFDSPSNPDTNANSSVNGEFVRIYNNSTFSARLDRFTIKDAAGYTFTFPAHVIGAKKTVYVHTGKGTNGRKPDGTRDSARLYQQRGWHIWNNTGDTATLRSSSGRVYDTCRWTSRGTGKTTCGSLGNTVVGPEPATPTPTPRITTPTATMPPTTAPPAATTPASDKPTTSEPPLAD
ncbi:lamin tail domain-containing protein [Actinoplanes auranticolor]|nr:lamin tail domain-containing protein [Actinoplanes auranticolor]